MIALVSGEAQCILFVLLSLFFSWCELDCVCLVFVSICCLFPRYFLLIASLGIFFSIPRAHFTRSSILLPGLTDVLTTK